MYHRNAYPLTYPAPFPTPAPHPPVAQHNYDADPSYAFNARVNSRYKDGTKKLWLAFSRVAFPYPDAQQQCKYFLDRLRIHRQLFLHTYVHLVSCCNGRDLHALAGKAHQWSEWGSIQQLGHHSSIRDGLISSGVTSCRQHQPFLDHAMRDDDSDLLCHILYCRTKSELYELATRRGRGFDARESGQVIELIWEFLKKERSDEILRRLRAQIYRMARKSAYLPHELQIEPSSIRREKPLDNGAHGVVSVAELKGQKVVIKKILCQDRASQEKCLEMFASEAILWNTLNHKNIVPFVGVMRAGTLDIGLVSQFFRNGNIKAYMARNKFSLSMARSCARDLAEALEYIHLHEPPIIHGDLKGDNVLVDDTGHARLGDFGQSHSSDSGKYFDSTRVGLAEYNPVHWMAPELLSGDDRAQATDKSDIYSFGCVLYEIMSGKIPFEEYPTSNAVMDLVIGGQYPRRPKSISENDLLWGTAEWCWRQDPARRPSATRLVSHLR